MTEGEVMALAGKVGLTGLSLVDVGYLGRFAELVSASEREACVQICVEQACKHPYPSHAGASITVCADAIRARGAQ